MKRLISARWAARLAPGILFSALFPLFAAAQAPPSADTFVFRSTPRANYGAWPILDVQPGATSYVQFHLSGLPQNAVVTKATLRLFVNTVEAGGSFDVYQVNNAWQENALNFSGAPAPGASATGGVPTAVTGSSVNQFVLIDVTSLVQQWLSGAVPNNGVALALTTASGSFAFDSKESLLTSHEPELEITLEGAAGAQGPQGLQGVAGPQGAMGPAGPQGLQGLPGPMGPQGPQGVQGPAGNNGISFNFRNAFDPIQSYTANDVVTFNGSTYIATAASQGPNNITPDQNPTDWSVLALAGAAGAVGPQGPAGTPGATGAQGPQGVPGATGPQGAMGLQGPAGPQGPAGQQGPAGVTFTNAGAWNNTTAYVPGNFVTFNGSSYLAVVTNLGAEPDTSNAWVGANLSVNSLGKALPAYTVSASGNTSNICYIGELRLFPYQLQGAGWIPADGRILPINAWSVLFTVLGTQFGGDGTVDFALPDYRAVSPKGSEYFMCVNGIYP